jgi:hypothetical protein
MNTFHEFANISVYSKITHDSFHFFSHVTSSLMNSVLFLYFINFEITLNEFNEVSQDVNSYFI